MWNFRKPRKATKQASKKTFKICFEKKKKKICFEDKLKGGRLKREQKGHLIGRMVWSPRGDVPDKLLLEFSTPVVGGPCLSMTHPEEA